MNSLIVVKARGINFLLSLVTLYNSVQYSDQLCPIHPHPENLKFPPRRFFLYSVARSLRSQISPILSTRNSMATDRAVDDHEQLIPNRV